MVRFRLAARAAFLIFRRVARFCLAEDIIKNVAMLRLDRVSPYQFSGAFDALVFAQPFWLSAIVKPRFVFEQRDELGATTPDAMPHGVVRVSIFVRRPANVPAMVACERALSLNHVSPAV